MTTAPGPRGHPIFGSAPDLRRDPIGTFMQAWEAYGDVVRFRLGGPFIAYLLAHPDHVRHVLVEHHRDYIKVPWYNSKLKQVIGEGLLTAEGEVWVQRRRLAQPAFHHQRLRSLESIMTAAAEEMLDQWERRSARALDIAGEMMRLTLTIVARALLGAEVAKDARVVGAAVTTALEHATTKMGSYVDWPEWIPLPLHRRFRGARSTLDGIVYEIIAQRRRNGAGGGDLLSMLLDARDEETGAGLTDAQLRDEVMTIFLAGHETTAVALTWTWVLLSEHPAAVDRLRTELSSVLAGRTPTVEDLPRVPYVRMILEESMRLYPPAWALTRTPKVDLEIAGHPIRRGHVIYLSPYVTHRHPKHWEEPERFDPERFTAERVGARHRFAYVPFGAGPRACIGAQFAMLEAQLILATVAQRYALRLVDPHRPRPDPKITLRARGPVRMIASSR